jgi:hypothetical protein
MRPAEKDLDDRTGPAPADQFDRTVEARAELRLRSQCDGYVASGRPLRLGDLIHTSLEPQWNELLVR